MNSRKNAGFTLIELLIVVAIIAILAAIAVPNFLEAQTRAKISRARADMRTTTTGLETYQIDNNRYPGQNPQGRALRINNSQALVLETLTTPISYLNGTGAFFDPFKGTKIWTGLSLETPNPAPTAPYQLLIFQYYRYFARNEFRAAIGDGAGEFGAKPKWYIIGSAGPDLAYDNMNEPLTSGVAKDDTPDARTFLNDKTIYNATNGTLSEGSLYRVGGTPVGPGTAFYHVASSSQ